MFLYILTLFTPASMYVCTNYLRSTFLTYTICRSWMRSSCHTYSSNISTRLLLHIPLQHTHIYRSPKDYLKIPGGHTMWLVVLDIIFIVRFFLQECLRVRLAQFLPQNEDTFLLSYIFVIMKKTRCYIPMCRREY